ncbi:MAG: GIY-YIG nuclease family protein [Bacilli bacterium]
MRKDQLSGWNYIVFTLLKNNFKYSTFKLHDLYKFEPYFSNVYPQNFHVKEKLRQTLQNLRDKGLLKFISSGEYQLLSAEQEDLKQDINKQELVYLLSNESIPGWVKIGRTNSIERRLDELYNTSVPLPFKVEGTINADSLSTSQTLESCIHNIIDTVNPNLRKNTEAKKREFFKMTPEEGKTVFVLVSQIMRLNVEYSRVESIY